MSRILIDGRWFDAISPDAYYESEIESLIFQEAKHLFPNTLIANFKKTVESDMSSAKADFVLIDKLYRKWWIVEVEKSSHSLEYHVIPQVTTLANAYYGDAEAEYIHAQNNKTNLEKLKLLIKNEAPEIFVMVNSSQPNWEEALRFFGVQLITFEIYRSEFNKHIFKTSGAYPSLKAETISRCYFEPYLPNFIRIENPNSRILKLGNIRICYNNSYSMWEIKKIKDIHWLIPENANPLNIANTYELEYIENHGFFFIEVT